MRDSEGRRLELVRTDVWGKASVPSLRGSLYFVPLLKILVERSGSISRSTSRMCSMCLKSIWPKENESGRKLKCLKSDNVSEYCDGRFEEFYAS